MLFSTRGWWEGVRWAILVAADRNGPRADFGEPCDRRVVRHAEPVVLRALKSRIHTPGHQPAGGNNIRFSPAQRGQHVSLSANTR